MSDKINEGDTIAAYGPMNIRDVKKKNGDTFKGVTMKALRIYVVS